MELTAVIITGASRGFGQAVAISLAQRWRGRLSVVLAARSSEPLQSTAQRLLEERAAMLRRTGARQRVEDSISVAVAAVDLEDLDATEAWATRCVERLAALRPSRVLLVNNAGSLGALGCVGELPSMAELRRSMDVNVTAALFLTAAFARRFGAPRGDLARSRQTEHALPEATVVNVTSLAAKVPFQSWGMYCAGKAARDMFHATLAKEQAHCPSFRVLSYAPGPMDTDMQAQIRNSEGTFRPLREASSLAYAEGALVSPEDSAEKLLQLVEDRSYVSGAHFDFYDELPDEAATTDDEGKADIDEERKSAAPRTGPAVTVKA